VDHDALPEDWAILASWLPGDLNALARECGFIRRARGLQDAERWLRVILMHVAGGLSLQQTAVRARELGLAEVSGVAVFKRLRNSEAWLRRLTAHLLAEHQQLLGARGNCRHVPVRVVDATEVVEPGASGSAWRIHYSLRLPEMICDHYELTDAGGGEKLGRFAFQPGELVIADRGYSHRAGVAHVLDSGAQVVVRWNHALLPLLTLRGDSFDPLPQLRGLKIGAAAEWDATFEWRGRRHRLRLCARRKGRLAAEKARRKSLRKAQKNGTRADPRSLELSEYMLVLTSAPADRLSCRAVLDLYRCRWQVELSFKRLKSLLGTGHVPKSDDDSARAWMQAKILTSFLIERTLLEARFFSPWGDPRPERQPLANLS